MPKKPVKTKTKSARPKAARTKAAPKVEAKAPTGMWKILEMKKAQHKLNEQARSDGRSVHAPGQAFQSHPRDPKFTKFAGPRRKVG